MEPVKVRFFAAARAAVGAPEVTVQPQSLFQIVETLRKSYPSLGKILPQCSYLKNGHACHDMHSFIEPGSELDVLPRFAGGAH